MTPFIAGLVIGLGVGLFCGWLIGRMHQATVSDRRYVGRGVAMPERPTTPPKVRSPSPPPSAGQGYNPPPVERVMRPDPTPAPPRKHGYPLPTKPWPSPPE